jgi:hypothetical protein
MFDSHRHSAMKGYLLCMVLLVSCVALFVSGCTANSGWGATFGGSDLQEDVQPSAPTGGPPAGIRQRSIRPRGSILDLILPPTVALNAQY